MCVPWVTCFPPGNPFYLSLTPPIQLSLRCQEGLSLWLIITKYRRLPSTAGFRGNLPQAIWMFVCVSAVFIKISRSYKHDSHPTTPYPYEVHTKPKTDLPHIPGVCVSARVLLGVSVCFCCLKSVRAKDKVSAISGRREYVFFSMARRKEKSGV